MVRKSVWMAAMAAGLVAGAAQAEVLRYVGIDPGRNFSFRYDGQGKSVRGGTMDVLVDGAPTQAYCVDLDHTIRGGVNYTVDPTDVPAEGPWCSISSILLLDAPGTALESAARQAAVWMLTYGDRVTAFPADITAAAQALIESVAGDCPLLCGEQIAWDSAGTFDEDGLLHVEVSLTRADGSAIPFQAGWANISAGAFVGDGTFTTDADGRATVVVDATGAALPIEISFATEGTRVVTLDADPQTFQRLVTALGICEYDPSFPYGFGEDGFGDPRTIGFWKHQVRGKGRIHVSAETLESWLPLTVLGETFETVEAMETALWLKNAPMELRAVQQCLATRLNVASSELGWATPLDLGDGAAYLFSFWGAAKDAFDAGDFETAKTICDTINNL
ncbi:MAG: hypothetical protein H6702_09330 [Myxococcales bacterium]|nr:hypothetical protein [Myxococcales bacterium]